MVTQKAPGQHRLASALATWLATAMFVAAVRGEPASGADGAWCLARLDPTCVVLPRARAAMAPR